MVQELQLQQQLQQSPSDTEQFYNLTQLAEVASQIRSTANMPDIKQYTGMDEHYGRQYYNLQPAHHYQHSHYRHPVIRPIPINYDQSTDNDYDKLSYEPTKKKWKNDWENYRNRYLEKVNESPKHYYNNENASDNNVQNSPLSLSTSSTPISNSSNSTSSALSYLLLSSPSSSISSDDDSSKSVSSYSHKVFDLKKQRTFRQLTTDSDSLPSEQDHREPPPAHTSIDHSACKAEEENFCDNYSNLVRSDSNFSQLNEETNLSRDYGSETDSSLINKLSGTEDCCHVCPECGKKYSTSSNLARHRQTHRWDLLNKIKFQNVIFIQ